MTPLPAKLPPIKIILDLVVAYHIAQNFNMPGPNLNPQTPEEKYELSMFSVSPEGK